MACGAICLNGLPCPRIRCSIHKRPGPRSVVDGPPRIKPKGRLVVVTLPDGKERTVYLFHDDADRAEREREEGWEVVSVASESEWEKLYFNSK